jgi:hypothetical protein
VAKPLKYNSIIPKLGEVRAVDLFESLGKEADEIAQDIHNAMEIVATYDHDIIFPGALTPIVLDAIDRALVTELGNIRTRLKTEPPTEVCSVIDRRIAGLMEKINERKDRRAQELKEVKKAA